MSDTTGKSTPFSEAQQELIRGIVNAEIAKYAHARGLYDNNIYERVESLMAQFPSLRSIFNRQFAPYESARVVKPEDFSGWDKTSNEGDTSVGLTLDLAPWYRELALLQRLKGLLKDVTHMSTDDFHYVKLEFYGGSNVTRDLFQLLELMQERAKQSNG